MASGNSRQSTDRSSGMVETLEGRLLLSTMVKTATLGGAQMQQPAMVAAVKAVKAKKVAPLVNKVPGIVQAERFGRGGPGVDFNDLTLRNLGRQYRPSEGVDIGGTAAGGYWVGWTQKGEWLQYTIDSSSTMTHVLTARVASKGVGGTFHLLIDGKTKTRSIRIPDTGGWGNWRTIVVGTVRLKAGRHTVQLHMDSVGASKITGRFDWIGFSVPAPAAPAGLGAMPLSDSAAQLSWIDMSLDEESFRIERSTSSAGPWQQVGVAPANANSYIDFGLHSNTTYYYRVRASSFSGDSVYSNLTSALTTFSGPTVITSGGIYRGNWASYDPGVAAVTILTDEPVVLENSIVRGYGNLIETAGQAANITIRNVAGYGFASQTAGLHAGRFLFADGFASVSLQNNYLQGTSGIHLTNYTGDHSANQTVRITRNAARNIDGRVSDGNGGHVNGDDDGRVQFVQIHNAMGLRNAEVAWNEVVNEPYQSSLEDNVSILASGGTADSPLLIHDNYIQGAYPVDPVNDLNYSGGGIMVSDAGSAYVHAFNNHVVDTVNYGIAISSGHDNAFYNNRILSSGVLPGGIIPASQNVGAYIWNHYSEAGFANNRGWNNTIGWMNHEGRNDDWIPDAAAWFDNVALADPVITPQMVADEYTLWRNKLTANGVAVGLVNDQVHNPIVITQGGTYSGIWQSLDANVPAVTILTSEPVIIENSRIRSRGTLIRSWENAADLTIRNNVGHGLNPNVLGRYPGRFLDLEGFVKVTVENNHIEGTSGIYVYQYVGNHTAAQTVTVQRNIVKNIDGRVADGAGGWLIGAPDSENYRQFFQINGVHGLSGAQIAWNQIINEPNQSRVEENINIHDTTGLPGDPIRIHNNYIQGAFPSDGLDALVSTGGGIMVSDNGSSYIHAHDNQIVNSGHVGMIITSGHDNAIYNNRIISSGLDPDGLPQVYSNVGAAIWNFNNEVTFTNNVGYGNVIGWVSADGTRNDFWVPDAAAWYNNVELPDPVTRVVEADEYVLWKQKLQGNGIALGPTQY